MAELADPKAEIPSDAPKRKKKQSPAAMRRELQELATSGKDAADDRNDAPLTERTLTQHHDGLEIEEGLLHEFGPWQDYGKVGQRTGGRLRVLRHRRPAVDRASSAAEAAPSTARCEK